MWKWDLGLHHAQIATIAHWLLSKTVCVHCKCTAEVAKTLTKLKFPLTIVVLPLQLVATVLSHRCDSRTDSGEANVESCASSETQPNQAALLLHTNAHLTRKPAAPMCWRKHRTPGDRVSVHCARPATGVASAQWNKGIPAGQILP